MTSKTGSQSHGTLVQQAPPAVKAEKRPTPHGVHIANEAHRRKTASDPALDYKVGCKYKYMNYILTKMIYGVHRLRSGRTSGPCIERLRPSMWLSPGSSLSHGDPCCMSSPSLYPISCLPTFKDI
ncbi:hypothetical protein GOODEAATRI_025504 [Goodea atripinnis]|uniref:Uncharacterized protein n=1 Tax=Goodea atripinnis TaxID=208336 RepID=A0ABV0MKQ1_9TELE